MWLKNRCPCIYLITRHKLWWIRNLGCHSDYTYETFHLRCYIICLIQFNMLENMNSGSRKILRKKIISCFIFLVLVVFRNCVKFQRHTQCQSQIIELEPRNPFKKLVFLVKSYKIEFIITSLMTTFTIQIESRDKSFLVASWSDIMTS